MAGTLKARIYMVGSTSAIEVDIKDKEKFLDCINDTSSCFKDNGALTLRFGNLLTGSNVGLSLIHI